MRDADQTIPLFPFDTQKPGQFGRPARGFDDEACGTSHLLWPSPLQVGDLPTRPVRCQRQQFGIHLPTHSGLNRRLRQLLFKSVAPQMPAA